MLGIAFAMAGQGGAAGAGQGSWFTSLLPLVVIFGIFYLLLIRPQQKQQKKHKAMLSAVKRGDKVITRGGIHGTIQGITESILQLEISDGIKVKLSRDAVAFVDQPTGEIEDKKENNNKK